MSLTDVGYFFAHASSASVVAEGASENCHVSISGHLGEAGADGHLISLRSGCCGGGREGSDVFSSKELGWFERVADQLGPKTFDRELTRLMGESS